jgi:16S rRNA (adenine1518-N6/adenine1519-N6)-dimethyltransferase
VSSYHAKKRLGQNFLKTPSVIERVVSLLDPKAGDTIVEIGPGHGALTLPLADSGATVWAVEFDRDLVGYLTALLKKRSNVRLIHDDFLNFDPAEVPSDRFKLIGNLPYNITSPVIDWCLKHRTRLDCAVLMVQRELGTRIAASAGGKEWSPLSILTQMVFDVEQVFDVSPTHFHPRPEVTSTVLKLTPRTVTQSELPGSFERIVRASFKHRRKLLVNNLAPEVVTDSDKLAIVMMECGLKSTARAEEVGIEQFLALTEALERHKLV